jgi:hypothetical protein
MRNCPGALGSCAGGNLGLRQLAVGRSGRKWWRGCGLRRCVVTGAGRKWLISGGDEQGGVGGMASRVVSSERIYGYGRNGGFQLDTGPCGGAPVAVIIPGRKSKPLAELLAGRASARTGPWRRTLGISGVRGQWHLIRSRTHKLLWLLPLLANNRWCIRRDF